MIRARPGVPFEATLEGAPSGGVGIIAVRVVDTPGGVEVIERDEAGIVEVVPGTYLATRTLPLDVTDPTLLVVWDFGDPDDEENTYTEALRLTTLIPPVLVTPEGAVVLDAEAVRVSTASLMAFRLRERGFREGGGGVSVTDFTATTTPTITKADEVTTRIAALVSADFPAATPDREPELRTIAALRSAIELEASVDNMDPERIKVWRDELREYVGRFADSGDAGEDPGGRVLEAVWSFGPQPIPRAPGSEGAWVATRRHRW